MNINVKDPRLQQDVADIRPQVVRPGAPWAAWLSAGGIILGGILLFNALDGQRRARTAPAVQAQANAGNPSSPLPPLYVLPEPPPPPVLPTETEVASSAPQVGVMTPPVMPQPQQPPPFAPQPPPPAYSPPPWTTAQQSPPQFASPPSQMQGAASTSAVLVIDATASASGAAVGGRAGGQPGATGSETSAPVQAGRLRRRATTIPQGALIPAVLETALDSTRPGHVRAIVSSDIAGFDGSRVLIPRGSRLFGQYQADLSSGQNRAHIVWTQLVRPDGVTIALASPAADMQGRIGVQGRVNNRFLERFSSALVQTTLNVGASLVGRSISNDAPVIVSLPGGGQAPSAGGGSRVQPTLRVNAGTRVAALVAQDLEFPSGESRR